MSSGIRQSSYPPKRVRRELHPGQRRVLVVAGASREARAKGYEIVELETSSSEGGVADCLSRVCRVWVVIYIVGSGRVTGLSRSRAVVRKRSRASYTTARPGAAARYARAEAEKIYV